MEQRKLGCEARHGDFAAPGAEPSYAPDLSLEPVHCEVRLELDVPRLTASGTATTTVRCNREGAQSLRLDAVSLQDLEVQGLDGEKLTWRYDGHGLDVTWETPFGAGDTRRIAVSYRVTNPISGMTFSSPDAHYTDRPLFVYTDHETERARYWLPCVDYPTVRTTFDFYLTAPADYTILANGTLEEETDNGDGTKSAHWKLDFPCPSYLCCFAAGRFVRYDDDDADGIPVSYFAAAPFTPDHLKLSFDRTPGMLRWIQKRLGVKFPFKKYYQIALPQLGGAMENISLVTWDERLLVDEVLGSEFAYFVDAVNIHEMAHSYFGDAIVCRHFEHSWLKEAWATYIETVWWDENHGRDERDYDLILNADRYCDEADNRYVRPIVTRKYDSSWNLFDAHLYPGGAWRLHMLRSRIGDEAFWAGVKDYVTTYGGKLVETDDFRQILEKHAGLNLTRFFDEWIYRPGYPKLKITFKHDAQKGVGTFVIEQTQADEKKGVGLFQLELDVDHEDGAGTFHRTRVTIEEARHVVVVPMPEAPKQIRVDPDLKALFALEFNPGDDFLKRTLESAKEIGGRVWAARELIKTGTRPNIRAVSKAMEAEPFWGGRVLVARALGDSLASGAIPALAEMLVSEKDPRAKNHIARACGKIRDSRLRHALLAFIDRGQPPMAHSVALESLGAQRNEKDFKRLSDAGKDPGIHGLVQSGALYGLSGLRSPATLDFLRGRTSYGAEPRNVRPAAVEAFGRCAARADSERKHDATEALVDLTRDTMPPVRFKAAAALAALGLSEAIPALETLKARHAAQDAPAIERMIARIRKGAAGEEVTSLTKQLEKLEEKYRKLDERLQDLESRDKED
ncbi:MAG: M1 family metallopeptidase [Planctomycetota bacterium]|nr:M1 family metallopeptidase [Planctomycetota bacterium]